MMTEFPRTLSDYDYDLPQELIAEFPLAKRPEARLLKLFRSGREMEHGYFHEVQKILKKGDVLVLNDTKVLPARLFGKRKSGAKAEALLLTEFEDGTWDALLKPAGRMAAGEKLSFSSGEKSLEAEILDGPREGSGTRRIRFLTPDPKDAIRQIGHIPLPPYIRRGDVPSDREDYQTVYARHEGAIAAPTAGLHFDQPLLDALKSEGVEIVTITLHTGYGTFQPVTAENILEHRMLEEFFIISPEAAAALTAAKSSGRRVIACGTTSVRALESAAEPAGGVRAGSARTSLFIHPPYSFKVTDGLITNFHLPKSTLLMLVDAFCGAGLMRQAYAEAVRLRYRFYSYGDAMIIL